MGKLTYEQIAVTTTGGAGAATGSATGDIVFRGKLHAVYVDYHASAPATTDVTISIAAPVSATLLTLTDTNTDGWYLPRADTHDETGAARLYAAAGENVADEFPTGGKITIDVAGANALTDCVVCHFFVE
ncbi:MAG: hypothetical protein GTO41_16040 [Burkholderiales bacterium]|nr:hypothetical protein [Burkholderiales bacterium]